MGWLTRSLAVLALLLAAAPAGAHVGSPNVFYDGVAGPYPVRVIVRPPVVVPGLAEITVKLGEAKAGEVTVQPIQWKAGPKGAPPPDVAVPVPGAPGVWSAQLWLMVGSSYGVLVHVQGPAGSGEVLVPVTAMPAQVLGMKKGMGTTLAALGLFLFAGAVTLVVSSVRESTLPPGEVPDERRRRKARIAGTVAAVLFALAIWQGRVWWNNVNAEKLGDIYKPFKTRTAVALDGGKPLLDLAIADERSAEWSPLMPDHGKLMHLFLLREPGLDAFAHLHPVQQTKDDFKVALPPLPAGRYRVYADVVHESGFPQTLVDTVTIPETGAGSQTAAAMTPDPDDSWRIAEPLVTPTSPDPKIAKLEGGGTMLWNQEPLVANRETTLRFEVRDGEGHPLPLEPYMGMLSHAVITRDDGKVFIHLHPMGTINMAAQESLEKKAGVAGGMVGMDHASMPGMNHSPSVLSFPYEFPQPGRYRLWVQMKSGGQVRTGVFDAKVGKAGK